MVRIHLSRHRKPILQEKSQMRFPCVLQCENCNQYLIEDAVLGRIDKILATVDGATELEIIRYAA